jgi:epoxide hydrolase-like predicted phosphatase
VSVPVRAVVFDIGGVLEVNPATGWVERWAVRLGLAADELAHRIDRLFSGGDIGAVTLAEIERRTADALDLDDGALLELMNDVWAEYLGSLNGPLAEYFRSLRPSFRTGMLSNSFVGAREREQDAYRFQDMCDTIVYSHEVGHLKPEPAAYGIVCERLGVAPGEVLFLDDVQANVDGACAVGMRAITFLDTRQAISNLEAQLQPRSAAGAGRRCVGGGADHGHEPGHD